MRPCQSGLWPKAWTRAQKLGKPVDPREVDSFLAFHVDGSVTLYTSKVDVGTGLRAAMSQMAAEELGIPVERITVLEGDTALTPNQGGTGGSSGIPVGGVGVRQAAATARQAILNLAAEQLKRPAAELTFADGVVRPSAGGQGIGIGTLIGGKRLALEVDPKAPLKDSSRYTDCGEADPPARCSWQMHREARLCARFHRSWDVTRKSDPPTVDWREVDLGG